jgi:hypothetical protein
VDEDPELLPAAVAYVVGSTRPRRQNAWGGDDVSQAMRAYTTAEGSEGYAPGHRLPQRTSGAARRHTPLRHQWQEEGMGEQKRTGPPRRAGMIHRHWLEWLREDTTASLPGYLCEACLDAPAVVLVPAPEGGEMGLCQTCRQHQAEARGEDAGDALAARRARQDTG